MCEYQVLLNFETRTIDNVVACSKLAKIESNLSFTFTFNRYNIQPVLDWAMARFALPRKHERVKVESLDIILGVMGALLSSSLLLCFALVSKCFISFFELLNMNAEKLVSMPNLASPFSQHVIESL